MREAFTYMFKDNCYYKKAIVFMLLTFIESACIAYSQMNSCAGLCPYASSNIVVPNKVNAITFQIIGLLLNALIVGYFNTCVEAITKQVSNIVLPFWNLINCFIKGLKYIVAIIIPVVLYAIIIGILQIFSPLIANVSLGCILVSYIILGVSFIWLFANEKSFWTFLNYKKAVKNIVKSPSNYFKHLLFIAITCIITIILNFVVEYILTLFPMNTLTTMLASTFISAIISAYFTFALIYLIAKSIKTDSVV